jgi:intracellular sulfur oxidation DsrE/DsrF family protein
VKVISQLAACTENNELLPMVHLSCKPDSIAVLSIEQGHSMRTSFARIIKIISASFLLLVVSSGTSADEKKAVYDLTSGDAGKIESRLLGGIKFLSDYYKKQGDEFKAVVVISGKSYKYFIDDLANSPFKDDKELIEAQKTLKPLIKELHDDYGVRFDMCGGGMKARKIKSESLYSFVHFDKVKPVYLINWQNEGYAYMPVP